MIKSILTTPPYSSGGGGADWAVCNNTGRKTGSCSKEFQVLKLRQKVDVDIRRKTWPTLEEKSELILSLSLHFSLSSRAINRTQ